MKVVVTKTSVEVEGEASEIREAVPSILAGSEPAPMPAAPAREIGPPDPAVTAELERIEDEPAEIVLPHEKPENDDAWTPKGGPVSPMPRERLEQWQDVPVDRRVWGSGCHTCHVLRDPQDPYSTFCGHDVGTAFNGRRVPAAAKVCGTCNRHIEIEARGA